MSINSDNEDSTVLLARVSAVALYIVLGAGMGAIAAGYLIALAGIGAVVENTILRNVLFVVALADLAATQFLRQSLVRGLKKTFPEGGYTYQALLSPTLVIASLCSAVSFYGLVALITGSSTDVLLLFVAISLIGFQVFRLRERDLSVKRK